jgi:hypothetical protein
MAQRPIFIPHFDKGIFVRKEYIEFIWYSGFSFQQKQKSIKSLHESAKNKGIYPVLEISTKSELLIGRNLSAFNLLMNFDNNKKITVEAAYQGSKVFENGGPYREFFNFTGNEIKKDERLQNSGKLIGFDFNGMKWQLEPVNAFYDWLYINALHQNPDLSNQILEFKGFSDIEFNPNKSINCQARAAALFVSLYKQKLFDSVISDRMIYFDLIGKDKNESINKELDEFSKGQIHSENISTTSPNFTNNIAIAVDKELLNQLKTDLNTLLNLRDQVKIIEENLYGCSLKLVKNYLHQKHPEINWNKYLIRGQDLEGNLNNKKMVIGKLIVEANIKKNDFDSNQKRKIKNNLKKIEKSDHLHKYIFVVDEHVFNILQTKYNRDYPNIEFINILNPELKSSQQKLVKSKDMDS